MLVPWGGDAKPIQGKSSCYAWGWGQHLPELAEFGGWSAAAHIRLLYLTSETERVGGSTQEDPGGSQRG